MGGLGNMMFQMSTLLSYAHDNPAVDPKLGYWISHQSEFSLDSKVTKNFMKNPHFEPWGGHKLNEPGVSLGDIFPNLPWFDGRPNAFIWDFNQDLAWKYDTGQGGEYVPIQDVVGVPFLIQGYFFNSQYWHHNRNFLLEVFEPSNVVNEYLNYHYSKLFSKGTVSLHMRMGNSVDFIAPVIPPIEWYDYVLSKQNPEDQLLIFTDNKEKSSFLLNKLDIPKSRCTFIEEDPHLSMIMMSKCDKHILSNSTLSFWGAYLDKKQENTDTYIHESFFDFHPKSMIPYDSWQIN
jgi:hypothetical protein